MNENEKKHKCPLCHGRGSFYLEGTLDRSGGITSCGMCEGKGYLIEEEHTKLEEERAEFNTVIKGDPPRSGIFSKKLKDS